ncbi:MAG: hypothetical protein HOP97_01350, partial [Terrabacter sp.]|nr:hypothetical protein [Terrabacter sp.]
LVPHAPLAAAIAARDDAEAGRLADAILTQAIDVWSSLTDGGSTLDHLTRGA